MNVEINKVFLGRGVRSKSESEWGWGEKEIIDSNRDKRYFC